MSRNEQDNPEASDWCACVLPVVEKLPLWGTVQCHSCKRPISKGRLELIEPFPK